MKNEMRKYYNLDKTPSDPHAAGCAAGRADNARERRAGKQLDLERAPDLEYALKRVAVMARRVATELAGTPYDEGGPALANLTRALDRAGF